MGRLPIAFETNQGQTDASVKYIARGPGYALYLSPAGSQLQLAASGAGAESRDGAVLSTRLLGSRADSVWSAETPLPGHSSYLNCAEPQRWRTNVAQYAKVRQASVYTGIDLLYYGNGDQLEYDFVVAPHADPRQIRLRIEGASALSLKANGDLAIATAVGELVQHKPVVYQEIGGRRVEVAGHYRLHGQQLAFELGAYDHGQALVIDPLLTYRVYVPLLAHEIPAAIAVDSSGSAYIVGYTQPFSLLGVGTLAGNLLLGKRDAFLAKLNADGSALSYVVYFGGYGDDFATAVAVDALGNAYVAGTTTSNDFPTMNAAQAAKAAYSDGFVTKFNANGTALLYSTFLGGVGNETVNGLALDGAGEVFVVGSTDSIDFPTTPGALRGSRAGASDGFVTKLKADGSFGWSTYLGGSDSDVAYAVAVDANRNAYVTGYTFSFDFPSTGGVLQPARTPSVPYPCGGGGTCYQSYADAFVSKFSADGSSLLYSTFLGGSNGESGNAIAVNSNGEAFVTGDTSFANGSFPLVTPLSTSGALFLAKLNVNASALLFSTRFGGASGYDDDVNAIVLDSAGSPVIVGSTAARDFPTKLPLQRANSGSYDAFVAKFTPGGNALLFSTYLGQTGTDLGQSVALDSFGNVYLLALTYSRNFPVTSAPHLIQGASAGQGDPIVAKLKSDGSALAYSTYVGGTNVYLKLAYAGSSNSAQTGPTLSLPIPLRGIVGCTLRAVDGGLISGLSLLFLNYDPCGQPVPAP